MSDSTTSPSRYAIIRFHKYKSELETITAGLVQPQSHDYMADLDAVENYRSPKEYGNGLGF